MLLFLWLIVSSFGFSSPLHIISKIDGEKGIQAGIINITTGKMYRTRSVDFPQTTCEPGWILGNGTHGQTSDAFYLNSTLFFFAQLHCGSSKNSTTLFALQSTRVMSIAQFPELDFMPENSPLHYHLSWDWACNIIVIVRNYYETNEQIKWNYRSIEVSFYDGQKRSLPDLGSDVSSCENCWRWVDGVSGVDIQHAMHGNEWNCGSCAFYTLEEKIVNYKAQKPRQLIGRGLHNGSVVSNVTDICQLQTMSYLPKFFFPPGDVFIGLGICCELSWCPIECEGHGGKINIAQWTYYKDSPRILLVLPYVPDPMMIKMGVAVDFRGETSNQTQISLWIGQKIHSYRISQDEFGDLQAKEIATSPLLDFEPLLWSYLYY